MAQVVAIQTNFKAGDFAVIAEGVTSETNVGKIVRLVQLSEAKSTPTSPVWFFECLEPVTYQDNAYEVSAGHNGSIEEYRLLKLNLEPVIRKVKNETLKVVAYTTNKLLTLPEYQ